jgi:cell division protease FtsH
LPHTDPVHKVSIIPRGRAGGYTLMFPEEDRYYMTRSELLDRVSTLLGGRVAEKLVLNDISTGAQNDLERATSIVRQMIMEYGMSESLGPITLGHKHDQVFLGRDLARDRNYSEEIAKAIDQEIRKTIDNCYQKAQEILEKNRDKLESLAQTLLEKETLDAAEIKALVEGKPLPVKKESPPEGSDDQADQSGANQTDEAVVDASAEEQDSALNGDLKEEKIKVISKKPDRRASFARRSETKEKPD